MKKFFKAVSKSDDASSSHSPPERDEVTKKRRIEIDLNSLEVDPGLRQKISTYDPNLQESIRRNYLLRKPCQPNLVRFPGTFCGDKVRRFNRAWYDEFKDWLEYSVNKNAAFCLFCYLFKSNIGEQSGGEKFVSVGFDNWKNKSGLNKHDKSEAHRQACEKAVDLLNQRQYIGTFLCRQSDQTKEDYRIRLNTSLNTIRYLLKQGLAFRGHDESKESDNRGNFLELLETLGNENEKVASVILKKAPGNHRMTSPDTQKEIVNACATETLLSIFKDIGDEPFAILVDESRDASMKEQMAISLRYVNENGYVVESFVGLEHVTSTTASSLKKSIDSFLLKHKLSISRLRGQGYDGASNMRGEYNGLKTLILRENESAHYVHCFAHQLQLAIVLVARKNYDVSWFFNLVSSLLNVVGGSCKRHDTLLEKHAATVYKALEAGELETGRGLNQECNLVRPSETRWGTHYETLASLIKMFTAVIEVLEKIREDGDDITTTGGANGLLINIVNFDFAFNLHFLRKILAITNELSKALQRKDQDIVNAMDLVEVSKRRLREMREDGQFDVLLGEITLFCDKYDIGVPIMSELVESRKKKKGSGITNDHRYRVEIYNAVLDFLLRELNERFNETSTRLLGCVACLNPTNSFSAFGKQKLMELASKYPNDFSEGDYIYLEDQFDTYIYDVRSHDDFLGLEEIGVLSQIMVRTRKHMLYPLVYRLLKLALILPVATASVERAFSAMKIVKNRLRTRMSDGFLNDCLVVYIEKKKFNSLTNDVIIKRFHDMGPRRGRM